MGLFFIKTESLKFFQKTIDGDDVEITNSLYTKLLRKWVAPLDSGNINADNTSLKGGIFSSAPQKIIYTSGITEVHRNAIRSSPYVFTQEGSSLIIYVLDYKIETNAFDFSTTSFFPTDIDPNIINDGKNKIRKLSGKNITDNDAGLTWTELPGDGTVIEKTTEVDLKVATSRVADLDFTPALTNLTPPSPFLPLRNLP